MSLERSLQTLIENNMDIFLGVNFLATEFSTTNGGRMDTLGIDENHSPVIVEYKRAINENVINQGLFYLDWLMDHRAEFELLVMKKMGSDVAEKIEWTSPRLVCIAGEFTKFDSHAVNQINRNIDLIRYRRFGEDLLLFELVTATAAKNSMVGGGDLSQVGGGKEKVKYKTVSQNLAEADVSIRDLYEEIKQYMMALGDDVQEKILDMYIAFRRIKNFACIEIRNQLKVIRIYVKVNPDSIDLKDGFTRDVRNIGHFGTGDLEITISDKNDFDAAKQLIERSYEQS